MAEDPTGGPPIVLAPDTYGRHAAAVEYVEGEIRTRAPRPGTGRFPGLAPGAWGLLADGDTITSGSGVTLGSGTVTLCDRDGTAYDPAETVDVVNAGAAVTATGAARIVRLAWTLGDWSVNCPGGS